ncbi:hypothetical protein HYW21_01190 [Candidatus Woesearchaeota archaeon]|nr:hypothetical protein [Candidatus Woesearchaeota archaeon]
MTTILLARMHTAEHIFFRSLQLLKKDLGLAKIQLGEQETKLFVDTTAGLTWEELFRAEATANTIVGENRKILTYSLPRKTAETDPAIRINAERIQADPVRIIEVEGFDKSACSGTHCDTTGSVGYILITRYNSLGKNRYEIRFTVEVMSPLYELSKIARQAGTILGCQQENILDTLRNVKANHETLKEQYRELSKEQLQQVPVVHIGDIQWYTATYNGVEKKLLIDHAKQTGEEKSIVCFFNCNGDQCMVVIVSRYAGISATSLQQIIFSYGGKGGGNEELAVGNVAALYIPEIQQKIKEMLATVPSGKI